jgi:apolipoprotein N-acyltransferase
MKPLALAFAAGAVSAAGFAPLDAWPLTLGGIAALLWLIEGAASVRQALARGWWFGLGHFAFSLYWIANAFQFQANMPPALGWVAVVLLSMLMAIYPAAAAGIGWRLGGPSFPARALALAGGWMLAEWLRGYLFGGFPWNPLGVVLLPVLPLAQSAALVGGLGLSGGVVMLSAAILALIRRKTGFPLAVIGPAAIAAVAGLALLWRTPVAETGPRLVIVQANIGQEEKYADGAESANFARYALLSRRGLGDGPPALLLWPEAAIPNLLDEEPETRAALGRLLRPGDLLLTGGVKAIRDDEGYAVAARNSLYAVDTDGRLLSRYDKAALVPFGEYLPLRPILSRIGIERLVPGTLDFWPGPGPRTLQLPGWPAVGPQICYEIVRPGHVADRDDRPAWILNASNDAWFSDGGAWMHLAQARLRAIEEGLPVARATPTGVSAVIDAYGRVTARLDRARAGILDAPLPTQRPATVFARAGGAIPLAIGLGLLGVAIGIRRRY